MSKNGEQKIEIQQKLRGPKPKGVVGRMKPRQAIEAVEKAQRERTKEEDEESWRRVEPYLR